MGSERSASSIELSAKEMGLDTIDLVLIHWPGQFKRRGEAPNDEINQRLRRETWAALEGLQREGKVKRIGVSNFSQRHLRELLSFASTKPA